jgi:SRSO17 transposase
MKPLKDNIPPAGLTSLSDVLRWRGSLLQLHARLASHFARPEPFQRALRFVQGILSGVERKNGWQLAEHAREATPYGMQRLLSQAVWDVEGVRDEVRTFALEQLGTSEAIVAIDETSFPKRGTHSAGVKTQYCGTTGHVENCQVGVFLSYITQGGHTLIDRALYLPHEWTDDPARCQKAGIPALTPFRTKPELAREMLERLHQARVPISWVVADSVYGGHLDLRLWLETRSQNYVMAIACDEPVVLDLPTVGVRRLEVREVPALLAADCWHKLSMSEGSKGPRLFEWACLPLWHQGQDDGWHSLLIRRPIGSPCELTFYLVFAPPATRLEAKVIALGGRWRIEEDFENSKALGLDQYEARSFTGWHRHMTLVMVALAFLVSISSAARHLAGPPQARTEPQALLVALPDLWPLSVLEARHLLASLLFPPPCSVPLLLSWSAWRRWHQRLASFFHTRRRVKAG